MKTGDQMRSLLWRWGLAVVLGSGWAQVVRLAMR
jgi:hypothetical protein